MASIPYIKNHADSADIPRVVAVCHFIAAYYAIQEILRSWEGFARATWPVGLGVPIYSDRSLPDVAGVVASFIVALAGISFLAVLVASTRGSLVARRWAAAVLVLGALLLAGHAVLDSDQRRCVPDSYTETEVCVSKTRAAVRDGITWSLPPVAAAAGLLYSSVASARRSATAASAATSSSM